MKLEEEKKRKKEEQLKALIDREAAITEVTVSKGLGIVLYLLSTV